MLTPIYQKIPPLCVCVCVCVCVLLEYMSNLFIKHRSKDYLCTNGCKLVIFRCYIAAIPDLENNFITTTLDPIM